MRAADPTEAAPIELVSGEWSATFLSELGMLGASVVHRGTELLSLPGGIDGYRQGHTVGLPLLAPWANRLSRFSYEAAGVVVDLTGAPGLQLDENGLPIHGTMTAQPGWQVVRAEPARLTARFAYDTPELLRAFPFPHELEVDARVDAGLRVRTALTPSGDRPVPVSFGWHPYFRSTGQRQGWAIGWPARQRLELDARHIPTGRAEPREPALERLGDGVYDDLFALEGEALFTLDDLEIRFGEGYRCAQVYAPPGSDFVAIEPMTAPVDALVTGACELVQPGDRFEAEFSLSATT